MTSPAKNLFLTGPPGVGKTTIIRKTLEKLALPAAGFYTQEIREGTLRVGFSIVTLDGKEGILAHTRATGKFRVGRYTVNLGDIERLAVPAMSPKSPQEIIVIDEVGKMECFSETFRKTLLAALNAPNTLLGTIAAKGTNFIEGIKGRSDVTLLEVNLRNRDELPQRLVHMLG